jgi:hypothetical protein
MALGTECIHTMQAMCLQGRCLAQSSRLCGSMYLCKGST